MYLISGWCSRLSNVFSPWSRVPNYLYSVRMVKNLRSKWIMFMYVFSCDISFPPSYSPSLFHFYVFQQFCLHTLTVPERYRTSDQHCLNYCQEPKHPGQPYCGLLTVERSWITGDKHLPQGLHECLQISGVLWIC